MITKEELSRKTPEELFTLLLEFQEKLLNKENEISKLRHHLDTLLQSKYGRKSDQIDHSRQGTLFNEAESVEVDEEVIRQADEEITTVTTYTRKKPGRKPLPNNLPRVRQEYDLAEEEKHCKCGATLTKIGEDRSEQLEFIPAKVQIIEHVKFKYACKCCEDTIKIAKGPKLPIPKSIASSSLLAYILVSKFKDHLPLHRQEQILQRIGIDIPRNTLAFWVIRCGELLKPLLKEAKKIQMEYDIGYSDESTVQVLKEKGRHAENKSYMWLFTGGPPEQRNFIYEYHATRAQSVAQNYWSGFSGYLHTDGYVAYTNLFAILPIQGVHCWAHARRKFTDIFKANKTQKTGLCHWAVSHIAKLYKIEREAKEQYLIPDQIKKLRQEKSIPLLTEMKKWLDQNIERALPRSPIGQALAYCLKYWGNLIRYVEDGRLDIDNNLSERAIKPFAIGRKNWMFADTPQGAEAAATLFSLIETCKYHQVEPYAYLKLVLAKIPTCKSDEDYRQLLPFNLKILMP